MAAFILTNAKVLYGGRDLSGILNQLALANEVDLQESTTFGDVYKRRLAGLFSPSMNLNGYWESASSTDSADSDLFGTFNSGPKIISASPAGAAKGDVSYSMQVEQATYNPGASLGEIFAFSLAVQGAGELLRGTVMELGTFASTANGTARQLGTVSSTQKIYSVLHVTAASGTLPTLNVTVESDNASGFASPVTRLSHTQFTSVGAELKSISGAITDDWWRLVITVGGTTPSFDIAGFLAIA